MLGQHSSAQSDGHEPKPRSKFAAAAREAIGNGAREHWAEVRKEVMVTTKPAKTPTRKKTFTDAQLKTLRANAARARAAKKAANNG